MTSVYMYQLSTYPEVLSTKGIERAFGDTGTTTQDGDESVHVEEEVEQVEDVDPFLTNEELTESINQFLISIRKPTLLTDAHVVVVDGPEMPVGYVEVADPTWLRALYELQNGPDDAINPSITMPCYGMVTGVHIFQSPTAREYLVHIGLRSKSLSAQRALVIDMLPSISESLQASHVKVCEDAKKFPESYHTRFTVAPSATWAHIPLVTVNTLEEATRIVERATSCLPFAARGTLLRFQTLTARTAVTEQIVYLVGGPPGGTAAV